VRCCYASFLHKIGTLPTVHELFKLPSYIGLYRNCDRNLGFWINYFRLLYLQWGKGRVKIGKEPLVPIGQEAGWDPKPLRCWREKFPAPAGNRTLEPQSPSAIPTELLRLLYLQWMWEITPVLRWLLCTVYLTYSTFREFVILPSRDDWMQLCW
jgi:hypothetical protein